MLNGHKPILRGSVSSGSISHALTFHTNCCQNQLSVSQIIRLEKSRALSLGCCAEIAGAATCKSSAATAVPFSSPKRGSSPGNVSLAVHSGTGQKLWARDEYNARHRRAFHTSSRSPFRRSEINNGPLPSLPKKPRTSTASNLPRPPQASPMVASNLPRPPSHNVDSSSETSKSERSAASIDMSLPSNPLQEFELEQERLRRENEERQKAEEKRQQVQRERREALRKQYEQEQLELAKQLAREDAERKERLELSTKLKEARQAVWDETVRTTWDALENAHIPGITDKASIERQLFLERISLVEWHLQDLAKEGGVGDKLRDIGNEMYYGVKDTFVDVSERLKIRSEQLSYRDPARQQATRRVRFRMYQILVLQHHVLEGAKLISTHMHLIRDLRRAALRISRSPEVSRSSKSGYALMYLTRQLRFISESIAGDYSHIHLMMVIASMNKFINLRWDSKVGALGPRYLMVQQHRLSASCVHLVRAHLEGLTPSEIQREVFLEFEDLFAYHRKFPRVTRRIEQLLQAVERWINRPSKEVDSPVKLSRSHLYSLKRRIQDTWNQILDVRRDLLQRGDEALLWRACTKFLFGNTGHSAPTGTDAISESQASNHSKPKALQTTPGIPTDWLRSTNLYPLGAAIPIHYVTTRGAIAAVLSRFSNSKVLAFDTVKAVSPGPGSFPIDFLIVASDREVAVFNLAVIDSIVLLNSSSISEIFEDPSILKVGANVDCQRKVLENQLGMNLEAVLDLHTHYQNDISHTDNASDDPTFGIISSMTAQRFGASLPKLDLSRAIKHGGLEDPVGFFTHLASRAYALMQLYQLDPAFSANTNVHPASSLPCRTDASLGPVLIYRQSRIATSTEPFIKKCPPVARSRIFYLDNLAFAMAQETYQNIEILASVRQLSRKSRRASALGLRKMMSYLKAYYLWTTFNETFADISNHLRIPSLAGAILEIAHVADLPLRENDGAFLEQVRRREQVGHHSWLQDWIQPDPTVRKAWSNPQVRKSFDVDKKAAGAAGKSAGPPARTLTLHAKEPTQPIPQAESLTNPKPKPQTFSKAFPEEQSRLRYADLSSSSSQAGGSQNYANHTTAVEPDTASAPMAEKAAGKVKSWVPRSLLKTTTTTTRSKKAGVQKKGSPVPKKAPQSKAVERQPHTTTSSKVKIGPPSTNTAISSQAAGSGETPGPKSRRGRRSSASRGATPTP